MSQEVTADTIMDEDLNSRLQRLKSRTSIDQKELEERVAKLKGIDPSVFSAPPITVYQAPDARSEQQKADQLLSQMMAESTLDQGTNQDLGLKDGRRRLSTDEELEERLNKLRGDKNQAHIPLQKVTRGLEDQEDVTLDSDEEAQVLMEKLLYEAKLPDVPTDMDFIAGADEDLVKRTQDDPSDSWCTICTEDARIRCMDCDGDIYCHQCFRSVVSLPISHMILTTLFFLRS